MRRFWTSLLTLCLLGFLAGCGAQTPPEPPRQTQQRQQQAAETAPDFDPTICSECGAKCSNGVVKYSQEQYGRTLCMSCQRKQGGVQ